MHRQALPEEIGNALAAIVAIACATRIGGQILPGQYARRHRVPHQPLSRNARRIDHSYLEQSRVAFPYPPGPYLLLTLLRVFGLETPLLLQLGAALADSLSVVIIYFIARRVLSPRTTVLAAGIYIFTVATYLTTWWSFDTHIIMQALYLLLLWGVIRAWEDWQAGQYCREWILGLASLSALVFLGHFGFLISSGALLGMLVAIVWVAG
ncbi:glycosyltransferase family 39 protein [Chloroflexus sp.]|uniref:glycosyltransferase family 39 protein n=1 Tax=Chloroflexus sp. TaxID=1904827 RepID=UPI002ACD452A|nr:glycosyltransferase family 39 protein [Chloroflexus sp.]